MNKKVVVLGGGTGLSVMLKAMKYINDIDISAIVTVADSGGSTGILSKHFGIPAVGDLRKVIAALSKNREHLEKSMEYRFKNTGTDLDGHTVGNLIITSQIMMEKNFAKGIEATTKMLNVEGKIIPVSNTFNHLYAELEDGSILEGEEKIGKTHIPIKKVFYKEATATSEAIKTIKEADYIFLGIGSLYTSLISNLIYPEIQKALKESKAKVIYFANIFTQYGETQNMTLKDHVQAIEEHVFKNFIDKVIVSSTKLPENVINSYKDDNQSLVKNDLENYEEYDLIEIYRINSAKHSEAKLKKVIKGVLKNA